MIDILRSYLTLENLPGLQQPDKDPFIADGELSVGLTSKTVAKCK